jgi:DNA-directed RNA polymerase specialized sigma24 family protein
MAIQDLNAEPTENLVAYMQWRDNAEYVENAKAAFRVFTFRFQLDLQKKLIPTCINWGYDNQVAAEIAYQTFERVWKYPTYDKTKSKQEDFDKGVKFYLYGIASHLLADYKRIEGGDVSPFTGDEAIVYEFPDIESMDIPKERKAILIDRYEHIKKALSRLSPKHKIIYLTYKQYEAITKIGYKLPRRLLESLRTELDLTQTSMRVYKKEAYDLVDMYLMNYDSK